MIYTRRHKQIFRWGVAAVFLAASWAVGSFVPYEMKAFMDIWLAMLSMALFLAACTAALVAVSPP
jgi:hypothetical protein